MNRELRVPAKILTGICVFAVSSFSQTYTVSAKPGAVNYIQGDVSVNGDAVWTSNLKTTFLGANDVITVKNGKAEVLLTPGVFLRLGENSEVRMIKPSLIETQIEIVSGESMIEVDDLVPGSSIAVMDHGSSTTLVKPGLFRFSDRSIASLDGKAEVAFGDKKIDLKKNKEIQIGDAPVVHKLDASQGDDLYAWSNTRAQYNAAATYAGSTQAYQAGGYGYSSFNSPGWYWNSPFSAYMWMPGNGAFYSPFGWGFYGPGVVAYAPVIGLGYYGAGGYYSGGYIAPVVKGTTTTVAATGTTRPPPVLNVPINPRNVPVANFQGSSPASFAAARSQMQQSFAVSGMRTASGAPAANLQNRQTFSNMRSASQAASASARTSGASSYPSSGGGWSGGNGSSAGASSTSRSSGSSSVGSMSRGGAGGGSGGGRNK